MSPEEFQNLSLNALSDLTGIHKSCWSLYFNGHRYMTERTLYRVALKLGMSPEELLSVVRERRKLVESRLNKGFQTT